jgi:hypothetical protein
MLVSAKERQPLSPAVRCRAAAAVLDPAGLVIVLTTLTALGLHACDLSRAGVLSGVSDYLAIGRILTAAAGLVCVPLMGRLARHRGAFATLVACGVLAVLPDGPQAARTVLVEPWLVLFCLIGAVAVFRRDRMAVGRGLVAGGVAFGFAGVIEPWAIGLAAVLLVLCLAGPRPGQARLGRAWRFAAGVAAGFCIPALSFAVAAPRGFPQSLLGLTLSYDQAAWPLVVILAVLTVGGPIVLNLLTNQPPCPLDWFAMGCTALVGAMFLSPGQFRDHVAAFLVPFLGLAIALPSSRLLTLRLTRRPLRGPPPRHPVRAAATACSVVILALLAFTQLLR